jgi:hypothetical protein
MNAEQLSINLQAVPSFEAQAKRKKPRGEQLLDRIDKHPNDREAWNELARGSPTKLAKRKAPAQRETR